MATQAPYSFCYFQLSLTDLLQGGSGSSASPHDLYLFVVFRLSYTLFASSGLSRSACTVSLLGPC